MDVDCEKSRQHSFVYKLRVNGEFFIVCKNFFITTHGITEVRVRRLSFLLLKHQTSENKQEKNKSETQYLSKFVFKFINTSLQY